MRIYVASSWRNQSQQTVVQLLRAAGHEVYDFKNPPVSTGFKWEDVDHDYKHWDAKEFRANLLTHPICAQAFMSDFRAMRWADACVMVLPCGKSAHMELGYFTGAGKRSIILMDEGSVEPELMYLQADDICVNMHEVLTALGGSK